MKRAHATFTPLLPVTAALLLSASTALRAASGFWIADANENWSNAANWNSSIIADGAGNTATFDLALTGARRVTNDVSRTIGNLVFGNSSTRNGYNWTLGGSQTLMLDNSGSAPVITCWPLISSGNSAVNLNCPLTSSLGLVKQGSGTLWLNANNTGLSGPLIVARGRVFNNISGGKGIGNMDVVISNGCYLSFWTGGTFSQNFTLNGLGGNVDGQTKSALEASQGTSASDFTISGNVTLNATSDIGGSYSNQSMTISGQVTGPGGLVKTGMTPSGSFGPGTLVLSCGSNTFAGGITVSRGLLKATGTNSLGLPTNPANLISVAAGASFDFNGQSLNTYYPPASGYTVSIAGFGTDASSGAVYSSATAANNKGLPNLRLAADASIGNNLGKFWLCGTVSGAYTLTKVGTSLLVIDGSATVGSDVVGLVVSNGTLTATPAMGNAAVKVYGPGTFSLYTGSPRTYPNTLSLNDGSTFYKDNTSDTWSGPVTLNGSTTNTVAGNAGTTLTISGPISGSGSLTKNGANALVLSGANTYSGATIVSAGKLATTTASTGGGAYSVSNAATLSVTLAAANATLNTSALTADAGSTLEFNLATFGKPSASSPVITVSGNFTPTATVTLQVLGGGSGLTTGQFPLLKYGNASSPGLGNLALVVPPGVTASLVDNTGNKSIDLNITAITPLVWDGTVSGNWDLGTTANWKTSATYSETVAGGPAVTFDDTAAGANATITSGSALTVKPLSVTVNNSSKAYSIGGNLSIGGTAGLTKSGSGTLTLSAANSFSGSTTVNGGALVLTHGSALGGSSVGTVASNARLVLSNGITAGAGCTLTINGSGGNFAGPLQCAAASPVTNTWAGNVVLGSDGARISSSYIDAAIRVSGVISGPAGYSLVIRNTGTGNNGLTILTAANTFNGPVNINSGKLSVSSIGSVGSGPGNLGAPTTAANAIIGMGSASTDSSTLIYTGTGETTDRQLTINSTVGPVTLDQSGSGLLKFVTDLSIPGKAAVDSRRTLTLQGSTSGIGEVAGRIGDAAQGNAGQLATSLKKAGTGTWKLSGNNTYSGSTTVNAGTLRVSGQVAPNSGTGSGTVAVNAGGTLSGNGRVGGAVTVANDATAWLYPNNAGGGALALGSDLTIAGSSSGVKFDLSSTANGANDAIVLDGASAVLAGNNATITINPTNGELDANDYILFSLTGASASIASGFNATVAWAGTAPKYAAGYSIVTDTVNKKVALHYTPIPIAVSAVGCSKTYDGTTSAPASPTVTSGSLEAGDTGLFTEVFSNKHAGIGNKALIPSGTIRDGGNTDVTGRYVLTFNAIASGTINPAPLTVKAIPNTKVYDGTTSAAAVPTVSGLQDGDTVTDCSEAYTDKNVGTGKTMVVADYTVNDGNNGNNYLISTVSDMTGVITAAAPAVLLSSSANPAGYRESLTFGVANLPLDATNSVVFLANGVAFSTNNLVGGGAISLAITNLPRAATNLITAIYAGELNYAAASTNLTQVITNHPPVPGTLAYSRAAGLSLKIRIADLVTNATDADGDALTLSELNLVSTNGVALTTNATYLFYSSTNNVADEISYRVSDDFGGTAAGVVTIAVSQPVGTPLGTNSISLSNHTATISVFGIPNYVYELQTATSPNGPWWPIATNAAGTNGALIFVDPNATNAQQFYRTAQP